METLIACVVAPLLQRLLFGVEDVSVTLPPAQKVVGPDGVIVGTGGFGLTVTVVAARQMMGFVNTNKRQQKPKNDRKAFFIERC